MFRGPLSGRRSGSRHGPRAVPAGRTSLAPGRTLSVQPTAAILKPARIMAAAGERRRTGNPLARARRGDR
jgi:hypothetical protein